MALVVVHHMALVVVGRTYYHMAFVIVDHTAFVHMAFVVVRRTYHHIPSVDHKYFELHTSSLASFVYNPDTHSCPGLPRRSLLKNLSVPGTGMWGQVAAGSLYS
uniref:Uncharacterized protein n=1 Tax=Cacopsylla melanoneura TaxID=428564 RepID=A0A8D8Y3S4_9HEMI